MEKNLMDVTLECGESLADLTPDSREQLENAYIIGMDFDTGYYEGADSGLYGRVMLIDGELTVVVAVDEWNGREWIYDDATRALEVEDSEKRVFANGRARQADALLEMICGKFARGYWPDERERFYNAGAFADAAEMIDTICAALREMETIYLEAHNILDAMVEAAYAAFTMKLN